MSLAGKLQEAELKAQTLQTGTREPLSVPSLLRGPTGFICQSSSSLVSYSFKRFFCMY